MKKHLLSKILFSLLFATLFFACKSEVDYNEIEKKSETQLPDISTAYTTPEEATKVYFYKQNKNADPDLSTYEHDSSSDITSISIQKGTRISQLNSLKSYEGFTFYTASQVKEVLNIYFKRNTVTYEFYSSQDNPTLVYKTTGIFESKVSPPSYTPLEKTMLLIGWEDSDGTLLGSSYGSTDNQYYPKLLAGALGTKGIADSKGDIILDDGSVISYADFCQKDDEGKSAIVLHAVGVLVATNYNSEQIATTAPENDKDTFYQNNINTDDARKSIFSGTKKLIAAVFKDNDPLYAGFTDDDGKYNSVPWISNADSLLYSTMNLTNYFDGGENATQLKQFDTKVGDFMQAINAFSSSDYYGTKYCSNTAYAEGWHLPSIGELGVFFNIFKPDLEEYATLYEYFYKTEGKHIWTSNVTGHSYDSSAIYVRNPEKSWTVELSGMTTKEIARYNEPKAPGDSPVYTYVIPFLILD